MPAEQVVAVSVSRPTTHQRHHQVACAVPYPRCFENQRDEVGCRGAVKKHA